MLSGILLKYTGRLPWRHTWTGAGYVALCRRRPRLTTERRKTWLRRLPRCAWLAHHRWRPARYRPCWRSRWQHIPPVHVSKRSLRTHHPWYANGGLAWHRAWGSSRVLWRVRNGGRLVRRAIWRSLLSRLLLSAGTWSHSWLQRRLTGRSCT